MPMLMEFRRYFEAHPTRESASSGITAVLANTRTTAIQNAQLALTAAEGAESNAKRARDLSKSTLKKRMVTLRGELKQLLTREDPRWRDFGFRRPADGRIPDDVEGLQLLAGTPGTVIVKWDAAAKADNYRVMWRPAGAPLDDATEVGLFSDLQALITGLTSGASVIVGVSARNHSGETEATEATIAAP